MFLLCFEPQPLLQIGSKALVCIHAKARGSLGLVWFGMPGRGGGRSGALCTLTLLRVAPCPYPAQDTSSGTSQ